MSAGGMPRRVERWVREGREEGVRADPPVETEWGEGGGSMKWRFPRVRMVQSARIMSRRGWWEKRNSFMAVVVWFQRVRCEDCDGGGDGGVVSWVPPER